MKDIVKAFDDMPWILKLVLCLPVLDIAWAVYRIVKGIKVIQIKQFKNWSGE